MPILELQGVSKHFGAIHALDDVSLTVSAGEVVGLMGDNGAGKSTLVKVVAGNFPPSHGKMLIGGSEVVFHRPVEARRHGIEIVYQDLALCDNLSAGINVFLSRELRRGRAASRSSIRIWRSATTCRPPSTSSWGASSRAGSGRCGCWTSRPCTGERPPCSPS